MAKRFDNDFDANGFVDNFRAIDGTIASRIPIDKSTSENQEPVEKQIPEKEAHVAPIIPQRKPDKEITTEDYQNEFLNNLKYRCPESIWKSVKISPDFITIIQRLITATGSRRTSFSSFINNVLEEHFREHQTEIIKILENDK